MILSRTSGSIAEAPSNASTTFSDRVPGSTWNVTRRRSVATSSMRYVDLRLQVVVVHQPRAQRFQPRVSPLLVEDASMPLRTYFLLNLTGRRRALEPYLDERAACHLQGQLRGLGLDDSLESNF